MGSRPGVAVVAALLVFGAGCKKPPPPELDAGPKAPDHLERNEIPEGREKAFALVLPLSSKIGVRFPDSVEVESQLRPEDLSNYIRAHVQAASITAGADRTTFENAIVATEPKRILHIEVRPGRPSHDMRSSMIVRDVTPLPPEPKVSDEEAWKRVGRGPDGKPLDPNHMF
jgi:hypothetical protein